ncbi:MAG: hypothetical protein KKG04_08215 [Candidatus Thermoplasmatota archaeon]|nr:hypothetical protein [Candidatus Thermoplasmatota archaeon]
MKKHMVWGGVLVALLMLVSSITVVNTVVSDPTQHTGAAYVGDLWISELDVSSELENVDYIGVGHTEAADDWVRWTDGEGNIMANWTVDIATETHPEYCVLFTLAAFNIDDDNNQMANDSMMKTYSADQTYNESGILSLSIEFDRDFLGSHTEATLVCYLSACVKINDTEEAINFTSWGQDRCVVGVGLNSQTPSHPFERFRNESNSNFPNIWSWIPGWNEEDRFDDEADMLESQTFFRTGCSGQSMPSSDWDIGDFFIHIWFGGGLEGTYLLQQNRTINRQWDQYDELDINSKADIFYINHGAFIPAVATRYILIHEGQGPITDRRYNTGIKTYDAAELGVGFTIDEDDDIDTQDELIVNGRGWVIRPQGQYQILFLGETHEYKINIVSGTGSSSAINGESGYYWEESCAYFNTTYDLDVSSSEEFGITTVSVDISDVLKESDECVYTYAGDTGVVQIEVMC